ncbi:MAG: nucleotidyltransferase domain-containing protein [Clostridia bacterium]|nr:nucleotidyltransferase domain-containing protein [Clostridia bacterium]
MLEWLDYDRVISYMRTIIYKNAERLNIEVISAILYGSRAREDKNIQHDYELMILINNDIPLKSYIEFVNVLRIEVIKEKLIHVKVQVYTPQSFEDILYNDSIVGTFLYMICRENIILYDKYATFTAITERLANYTLKSEEVFLSQCVDFAKMLGSEKWRLKWDKILSQVRYNKKRGRSNRIESTKESKGRK